MKRKIISLLLAVVMVLSMLPGAVFAEGTGTITFNMADSCGDSWNGNQILVYENGTYLTAIFLDYGLDSGSSSIDYDSSKVYTFIWSDDSWSHECSFEILLGDEVLYTATSDDCNDLVDMEILYTIDNGCAHIYGDGTVIAPDCDNFGYTSYTCTVCGDVHMEDLISAGCSYEFVERIPGSCDLYPCDVYICTICGNYNYETDYSAELSAHTPVEGSGVVTEPGCIEDGYTTYECSTCGQSYQDDWVTAPGHTPGSSEVTPPTCMEYGYTTYSCTVCGETYQSNYTASTGHTADLDSGVVTAPNCVKGGYTTYPCADCDAEIYDEFTDALGHNNGTDGKCTVCGADGTICFQLFDSWGDSWNGNGIDVYVNGTYSETITLIANDYAEVGVAYYADQVYEFYWVRGDYSEECHFNTALNGWELFSASTSDCNGMADGEYLFTIENGCEHSYDNGVNTPATCTEYGYTTYTCTECGYAMRASGEEPTGHNYLFSDVCYTCGEQKAITIEMSDACGDGWNGTNMAIIIDGELYAEITLDSGYADTWSIPYDCTKTYEFYFFAWDFADECTFHVMLGNEVLYAVGGSDCYGVPNGEPFLTLCGHDYVDGVCSKCGECQNPGQIKWQLPAGASAEDTTTDLRLITFVDSLEDYSKVSFTVSFADASGQVRTATWNSTNAYETINANGMTIAPSQLFGDGANYLLTFLITGWPQTYFDTEITVTVNRYTNDGDLHSTATRSFVISDAM